MLAAWPPHVARREGRKTRAANKGKSGSTHGVASAGFFRTAGFHSAAPGTPSSESLGAWFVDGVPPERRPP